MKSSKSFKASSLIESIIAIVLISICSLVALTVYLNVIGQNNPIAYYEAKHTIEHLADEAQKTQNFEKEVYSYKHYSIEKNVKIKKSENIAILNYKITSGNKNYNVKKLISIEKKE